MRHLKSLVLAGGLWMGVAASSEAQFSLSIGNPYTGQGVFVGAPTYGSSLGYPAYGASPYSGVGYSPYGYGAGLPGYSSGYNSVYSRGPGTFAYSSGYNGYVAPVRPLGYGASPYYRPYRPNYGGYGYGYGSGYRPYRNGGWFRR